MTVASVDRLMPQNVACFEIYFQLFQPGICRAVMEVVCNDLAQRPGVSREGMGERGSNSFFAQKLIFFYLNQENSFVTFFLDFARLSDSQPSISRAIGA